MKHISSTLHSSANLPREEKDEPTDYIRLDSVYARTTSISGPPLTDSYHFGQTIVNDYGRPFQRGTNGLAGFSSSGVAGALAFSVRGEYEHAPSAAGYSQAVQDAIQVADFKGPAAGFCLFLLLTSSACSMLLFL